MMASLNLLFFFSTLLFIQCCLATEGSKEEDPISKLPKHEDMEEFGVIAEKNAGTGVFFPKPMETNAESSLGNQGSPGGLAKVPNGQETKLKSQWSIKENRGTHVPSPANPVKPPPAIRSGDGKSANAFLIRNDSARFTNVPPAVGGSANIHHGGIRPFHGNQQPHFVPPNFYGHHLGGYHPQAYYPPPPAQAIVGHHPHWSPQGRHFYGAGPMERSKGTGVFEPMVNVGGNKQKGGAGGRGRVIGVSKK